MNRRNFGKTVGTMMFGSVIPIACSSAGDRPSYETLVEETWRHSFPETSQGEDLLFELVRYGTLAANSHNTQPWKFKIERNRISILPDFTRRCAAVDPDDHHLFASLGCALENMVLASRAFGLREFVSIGDDYIQVDLEPGPVDDSTLFQAIPERLCTRSAYDGRAVSTDQLALLEKSTNIQGITAQFYTADKDLEAILEYVVAGNTAQLNDESFVTELKEWVRFNKRSLVESRDGLFSAASGNPELPTWLGNTAFDFFFKEDTENEKYRDQIRSSAGVVVFISEQDNKESWINAGRSYQRFALQSTAIGLKHAFINQAVEVLDVRDQFAEYLDIGGQRPDLVVRFGYGPLMPRSLRRPIDQVVV